ncbi:PIN domain-containing protein [Streptomyces sp. NPDC012888]|uniref:PIN domain-containing protein n=1 Tax=Streptomyces sp. NPDC012888 TaxID=3364855 RepID=UPI0036A8C3CD
MRRFLLDSSALWRIQRDKEVRNAWSEAISSGVVGSCWPQRSEFRRSARNRSEYDAMSDMFDSLYPDVTVPKSAPQWIEAAQHQLARTGGHQALSVVDLLIAATAAHHGLTVLHDDGDFVTLARSLRDLRQRNVRDVLG